jgi:prolyl 4-hydroxylase
MTLLFQTPAKRSRLADLPRRRIPGATRPTDQARRAGARRALEMRAPRALNRAAACALLRAAAAGRAAALAADGKQWLEDVDRFPGWRGELPSSRQEVHDSTAAAVYGELGEEVWRGRVEQVSWQPRAFVLRGFLSMAEADHLVNLGEGRVVKSTVVNSDTGESMDSDVRTSSGTFLAKRQDDVVAAIERRLAHVTMLPESHGEALQLLKYVDGQKYEPHTDYFHDAVNSDSSHGGQRMMTVLMYLATPEEGGETVFPRAAVKVIGAGWSDCARRGLAVKAVKGDALMFYSLHPNGTEDVASTHGSCPTTRGVKWSATSWRHVSPFRAGGVADPAEGGPCADRHEKCGEWAAGGECEKNPGYMASNCAAACGRCVKEPKELEVPAVAGGGVALGRKGATA